MKIWQFSINVLLCSKQEMSQSMTKPQMSAQWRLRSVCAPVQYSLIRVFAVRLKTFFGHWLPKECQAKTLIRLFGCTYDFADFVMIQLKLHDWPRLLKFRQCTAKLAKLLRLCIPKVWSNSADRSVDPKLLQADSEDSCLTARMRIWAVWCACWSESLLYACVIYRLVVP